MLARGLTAGKRWVEGEGCKFQEDGPPNFVGGGVQWGRGGDKRAHRWIKKHACN